MLHVEFVHISTERGVPFHPSVIPLLARWIIRVFLTNDLRRVRLQPYTLYDARDKAVFERIIREAAADVSVDFPWGL